MTRSVWLTIGVLALGTLWLGPLPALAATRFSAHMALHMGVVAVAAPLIALGLAGGRFDPSSRMPALFGVIAASVFELLVVWGWHAPALHHAARHRHDALALEQATFLLAGLWLWLAAFGGAHTGRIDRAWAGVAGLLFTSIHMTLLGAVFAMAPRALYGRADMMSPVALADQHLGGGIMLLVGGASYLAGGLWLAATGLRSGPLPQRSAT